MKRGILLALFMTVVVTGRAAAQDGLPAVLRGVGIEQRLDTQVPLELVFRDEENRAVRLGDYFQSRPVILVLAYYRCPKLCTEVLNGLLDSLRKLPLDAGEQFQVVVVSFDARETSPLAAAKKQAYVESYGRASGPNGWHFLTGAQASIDRLTQAVGFHYAYDANSDQFAHASGICVLTPHGRIARYFFGIRFPPRDLRLGLVEASENKIGTAVDQVLLFCFHYDPATGQYTAAVMNLVRLGGVATLLGLGVLFFVQRRRRRLPELKIDN
jgi:protein SCO1